MEVSVRPPEHNYDVIPYHRVSKLTYFVEHDIGYQPSKFQCSRMYGSNFMKGRETPPPKCYDEIKRPSAYRVNKNYDVTTKTCVRLNKCSLDISDQNQVKLGTLMIQGKRRMKR